MELLIWLVCKRSVTMSKCLTVGGHYWLDVGQYCHDEKWVCVTLVEILINDKKGIHAQILSVASVHRLKQSPEKWAWAYHWFHSKKKRKIISREDVRRRTTIGRDYFCAYRTKVVFLKKKDVFSSPNSNSKVKAQAENATVKSKLQCFGCRQQIHTVPRQASHRLTRLFRNR